MGRFGIWIALSLAVGIGAIALAAHAGGAPWLNNDSFQYLDAAHRYNDGECLCIHIAHFDDQVAFGHFPVPMIHFAPGYSIAIAFLSRIGLSPENAGFLLSVAGYLITLLLLWDIGNTMGSNRIVTGLFSLLWIANTHALTDGLRVGTEALFTALMTLLAALILRDLHAQKSPAWLPAAIGAAAGLAYAIRYAGLFLLPAAALYLAWRWWRNSQTLASSVGGLLTMGALMFSIQIRNFLYSGSWRGGFTESKGHGLKETAVQYFKALYHVVFGDRVIARLDIWSVLFALSLAVLLWLLLDAWRRNAFAGVSAYQTSGLFWLVFLAATYGAGIFLTNLLTIASDLTRYLIPVYPLLLAALAWICSVALKGRQVAAVALVVGSILIVHSRSLALDHLTDDHEAVRQALATELQPGVTARDWLLRNIPEQGSVVSVSGQGLYYELHRNVVAIIAPEFTSRNTAAEGYHDLMRRFQSRYLVVFPGLSLAGAPDQEENPFLRGLADGPQSLPPWLHEAARDAKVAVYECTECGG